MKAMGAALVGAALAVGCTTVEERQAAEAALAAEIAARQGEQVDRICFIRDIDNWRRIGDDAVLVERGVNDWYKLDLIGTCDPDDAFLSVAIRSFGGSSCLTRGDQLLTPDAVLSGRCSITRMHRWDETAEVAAPDAAPADGG